MVRQAHHDKPCHPEFIEGCGSGYLKGETDALS
jgi:hypothetical protein